jgi:hypothetical protein
LTDRHQLHPSTWRTLRFRLRTTRGSRLRSSQSAEPSGRAALKPLMVVQRCLLGPVRWRLWTSLLPLKPSHPLRMASSPMAQPLLALWASLPPGRWILLQPWRLLRAGRQVSTGSMAGPLALSQWASCVAVGQWQWQRERGRLGAPHSRGSHLPPPSRAIHHLLTLLLSPHSSSSSCAAPRRVPWFPASSRSSCCLLLKTTTMTSTMKVTMGMGRSALQPRMMVA